MPRFKNLPLAPLLGALAFAPVLQAPAQAASLSVVGAFNLSKLNESPVNAAVTSYGMGTGFGGGALFGSELMPLLDLEVGALYVQRAYRVSDALTETKTTLPQLELPVLVRFTGLPLLSFGAGGYFTLALGDGTVAATDIASGASSSTSATYQALRLSKNDFGLVGSVAVNVPIAPLVSLRVDARYLLGLKDLSTAEGTTYKLSDIQVLAGVSLGF